MTEMNINRAAYGDLTNTETNFEVAAVSTDGAGDQKETTWQNTNWATQLGYYKKIPELKIAIDAKATWTVGKGFLAEDFEKRILLNIKGFGRDTFNTILENMIRTYHIGGDAFAEIIRDEEGNLINIKPLDPGSIVIVANRKGIIIRYEQTNKVKGSSNKKFNPEQIFHLSRNRVADEIHGESLIDALETIILMRNEAMADMKQLMHRHVKPRFIHKLDTDIQSEIDAYKVKADYAADKGENLFIPQGTVEVELMSVPANATLNPLPWIDRLNAYFYQAAGVPQIIVGGSQEMTEATAKILYLAWEQTVEEEQLYAEEQVGFQLGLSIELDFPASLQNDLITSVKKGESTQAATPEDTSVTGGMV